MGQFTTEGLTVINADEGETRWINTSLITTKLTADETAGGYGLIVSKVARGNGSPLHVHHTADEGIYLVSGKVRVRCGEDEFTMLAGDYAHLPREVPHAFVVEEDCEMLGLNTPGGSEKFYAQAGPIATTSTPPSPDRERMAQAARDYGQTILGPGLTLDH